MNLTDDRGLEHSGAPDGHLLRRHHPWVLRDYGVLADGQRGALVGPHGDVVWMCAPRWDSPGVFARLIGGEGHCVVSPDDPWHVWGGYYEDGSLIRVSRWVLADGVVECREALALPADPHRAVLLRRVRAVRGDARVRFGLDARSEYGQRRMTGLRHGDGYWSARAGDLYVRVTGADWAAAAPGGQALEGLLRVPEGQEHDLVVEIGDREFTDPLDARRLWAATEDRWREVVPPCEDTAAPRDARHAYAVLHGLTSQSGGMVAAATTSLPERVNADRDYDYRFTWIRDQCYAAIAAAAHGTHPLVDTAVRFISERVLDDGPSLRPAYTVDGGPVLDESTLPLPGYPGGIDRIGNHAGRQYQLDTFGEVLQLYGAAARLDRLDGDARRALDVTVRAVEENWTRPDEGIWELGEAWWSHSRLSVVAGLRAVANALPGAPADRWNSLADRILGETRRRCLHPEGYWKRAEHDDGVDAALLLPLTRGAVGADDPSGPATRRVVEERLTEDGYVYRFRHGDQPLGEAEGAFLLCGFMMSLAAQHHGDQVAAYRWFERTRSACGPPGLFAEEYDVGQRQLRGNLPQAFVHAMLIETAVRLADGKTFPG